MTPIEFIGELLQSAGIVAIGIALIIHMRGPKP